MFAAGVAVCGMSDFSDLLPGHRNRGSRPLPPRSTATPVEDEALLAALSPMRAIDDVTAPLLVVHGGARHERADR
ncbi:hypothetical protein Q9Q99_12990 [Curtobacterium flaccumfaciens]|nr:hypothetical protein Q9Q99_12990 [Curtobacterium flaccumfaciens]